MIRSCVIYKYLICIFIAISCTGYIKADNARQKRQGHNKNNGNGGPPGLNKNNGNTGPPGLNKNNGNTGPPGLNKKTDKLPPGLAKKCSGRNCPQHYRDYEDYIQPLSAELQELSWHKYINGSTLSIPDGQSSRYFYIAYDEPDRAYQACSTPNGEIGHCRHLQYCIQDSFRQDYNKFLNYWCLIDGSFVGVCCPDYPSFEPTTNRPTTRKPSIFPTKPSYPAGECGLNTKTVSRIVGGRAADPRQWPWMVALLRDQQTSQYCGGVLLTNQHVLTAAHCVDGFSVEDITIRLGEYDFKEVNETAAQDFQVDIIHIHGEFNRYSYINDIAIIKLKLPASFNSFIRPVCMPPPDETFENQIAIVTGWGTIYYGGPSSDILMEVLLPVWNQKDCDDVYTQPIVDTFLCAGVRSGSRDSCQGDSGGPLLYQLPSNGRWVVIGIVSWGIRCAEPGYPGVYIRVNKYLDWIQSKIKL